jgi:hypothetical protein
MGERRKVNGRDSCQLLLINKLTSLRAHFSAEGRPVEQMPFLQFAGLKK